MWLQGLDNAPLVVRKCYQSWQKHNAGWHPVFLDENNISDYITLKNTGVLQQAFSDIVRINLLAKYGGVWVDATCFCNRPLDEWLAEQMSTGFFAFNRPAPDRMISSWFIASAKYNYITVTYKSNVNAYWAENSEMVFFETSAWKFLKNILQRRPAQIWFNHFASKLLKVYPYFWFHYLFEHIYLKDGQFKEQWDDTPKLSADGPHKLQTIGLFNPLSEAAKQEIDQKKSPVYKLTWKYDESAYKQGTIMYYLLQKTS